MAKKVQEEIQTWDLYLNQTLADIKFHGNESTKYSLFFLLYNRHVVLPLDTLYYIKTSKLTKKIKEDIFHICDPVYLKNYSRTGKLDKGWVPYYRTIEKDQ